MTDDSGVLSIDFLVGFTIFLIAFIWVLSLIPGLLIGLQAYTIDYDAVAYRTGVILVEDPGEPLSWQIAPYNQTTYNKNDVLRFGLAVSRDDPNILSLDKVNRFFTFNYPDDYRNRLIFGDYPYGFNISLQYIGSNESEKSIGDVLPEGYGYIRHFVKVKSMSYAIINGSSPTAQNYVQGDNETTHVFTILLNNTYLTQIKDPAYEIIPGQETFMINLTNLNSTLYADRRDCFDIRLNTIKVYDDDPILPTSGIQIFQDPIIDEVPIHTQIPQWVKNNVTILYKTNWDNTTNVNRDKINWNAPLIYISLVFNLEPTHSSTYCDAFQGSKFLNNTIISTNYQITAPFFYDYNSTNVTQPQLRDAIVDVAVWGGAFTESTGPVPTPTPVNTPGTNFIAIPTSGVAPLTVVFVDTSTNTPTSWSWTFGDGNTSTSKNPLKTYSSIGTYTVSLTATNAGGSNAVTRTNYITVTAMPAPTVTSISPTTGLVTGNTLVTIIGTGFNGTTAVKFGLADAISFTVNSTTQITATSPASATNGTVDITVTTPIGTSAVSPADRFTFVDVPTSPTPITAIGPIIGTPEVSSVLTAGALTPGGATATYQWSSSLTSGGTYTNISGATSTTYTPVAGDLGYFIKVTAVGTGSYTGTVTSGYVGPVTAIPLTAIGPIIGTPEVSSVLTAGALTPLGATVTYQWQKSNSGSAPWTNIGTNSNTYTPVAGDLGSFIRVNATGTGSYSGTVTSPNVIGPVLTPLTNIGLITGPPVVGGVLTAGALTPGGATAAYQWQKSSTGNAPWTNIGTNSNTYTPVAGDLGTYIRVNATGTGFYSGTVTSTQVGHVLTRINSASITGFVAPVFKATPQAVGSLVSGAPLQYTVTSLTWSPAESPYKNGKVYTANVVLTSATGYTFTTALTPTVNTGTPGVGTVTGTGSGNTLTFTVTFPST
jgi:PKD repeat protein